VPTLGDVLAAARNSAGDLEAWLSRADPQLASDTAQAADRIGIGISTYARMAVADFSRLAGEEDWATLISSVNENPDAGATCLSTMVRWRLDAPACSAHASSATGGPDDRPARHTAEPWTEASD